MLEKSVNQFSLKEIEKAKSSFMDPKHIIIVKKFQLICKCNHLTYGAIASEILKGKTTIKDLASKLKVTRGDCKGERCRNLLEEMIKELTDKP